ncbi:MAG TPA: DUF938 domain-containing protein [Dongiaceae bacterium]|nr:DUF938 domain-containing protein [Dongiaceae bacterium]
MMIDARQYAPAAARNRDPICAVLREVLPPVGLVLEVASGSGEHAVHFATAFPALTFQPSDPDPQARDSIAAWRDAGALANLLSPLAVNAAEPIWPLTAADAVICINMVHISPWASTVGLLKGAAAILPPGAPLYLYGPYRRGGAHTAASNAAFDADLRSRNPAWGLRDMEAVVAAAETAGFAAPEVIAMPANNFSLVFRRAPSGS